MSFATSVDNQATQWRIAESQCTTSMKVHRTMIRTSMRHNSGTKHPTIMTHTGVLNTARHLGRMAGMILAELTTKSSKQSQLSVFQVFLGNFKDFLWFFCFWCFSVNFDPICVQLATPTGRIIFQVAWNMTCWYIFGLEQISPSKLLEACMSFMVGLIHN